MNRMASAAMVALLISSCSGTLTSMVKESDKDPADSFDGDFVLTVKSPGGRQELGNGWFVKCGAHDFSDKLTIHKSKVGWRVDGKYAKVGFINADGKFRLEHPLDGDTKGIGLTMSDGSRTLILEGDLSEDTLKGRMTYGVAQFNNRGCSYRVTYAKM